MVSKILDFRFFESLKNALSRTFYSLKLSLESWISHCLRQNVPEYPPCITMRTSIMVYLILQHFHGLKTANCIDSQTHSQHFFRLWQKNKCCCWYESTAHDEVGGQEQRTHLISLLGAKIFAVWSTRKIYKYLTVKSRSPQNGKFQGETGGQELSSQNGSLLFKPGELDHMPERSWLSIPSFYLSLNLVFQVGYYFETFCWFFWIFFSRLVVAKLF